LPPVSPDITSPACGAGELDCERYELNEPLKTPELLRLLFLAELWSKRCETAWPSCGWLLQKADGR
jgi:hypothetical protein